MEKFALVHIGNDEVYGIEFVATEIVHEGHEFYWFDGDEDNVVDDIGNYGPDVVCFSPLTTFFPPSVLLARNIKSQYLHIRTAFGGAHVSACEEHIHTDGIDIAAKGPVYGTTDQILNAEDNSYITG